MAGVSVEACREARVLDGFLHAGRLQDAMCGFDEAYVAIIEGIAAQINSDPDIGHVAFEHASTA